jgi:hypothetical protein
VTTGVVAFSNLTSHEFYNGKDTGKYSIVITMEPEQASILEDLGVIIKDYKGAQQRKFSSQYHVGVVDLDNSPFQGEVPYGSVVRLLWATGPTHPEFGTPTYLNKVRVVELSETAAEDPEDF